MRYIWEVFLKPENEEVYVRQAEVVSPYYEMASQAEITDGQIEYNAMYRYESIFAPLLTQEGLDIKSGLSVDEYRRRQCMQEMKDGSLGEEIQKYCSQLETQVLYQVAAYYTLAEKTEATVSLFAKALIEIVGTGVLYKDKDEQDLFYYYVGRTENQKDTMIIQLVRDMLLPLGKELRIFWNQHFGICGQDITMQADEIVIV